MTETQQRKIDIIRALLAQAESTPFDEEAEAFTAKAQELMTAYGIEETMLAAKSGHAEEMVRRDVKIPGPYLIAKRRILSACARFNDCEFCYSSGYRTYWMGHVVGTAADAERVELLFTSLLLQAAGGMRRNDQGRPSWENSQRWRYSYLYGYADAVHDRLRAALASATKVAVEEHGPSLLPMLRDKRELVKDEFRRIYPKLGHGGDPGATVNSTAVRQGRADGSRADVGGKSVGGGRRAISRG